MSGPRLWRVGERNIVPGAVGPDKLGLLRPSGCATLFRDTFFDWAANWTTVSNVTLANDDTNVRISDDDDTFRSMSCTAAGATTAHTVSRTFSAVDWSAPGNRLICRYYMPEGAGESSYAHWTNLMLRLYSGGSYRSFRIWYPTTPPASFANVFTRPGWCTVVCELGCANGDGGGTFNPAAVTKLELRLTTDDASGKTPAITLDLIAVVTKPNYSVVAWTHDDCKLDGVAFAGELTARQLVGTFVCNGAMIGIGNRATAAQLRAMQANGHLIANHTNHEHLGADQWDAWNLDRKKYEIVRCKRRLWEEGLVGGERILATPGGYCYPEEDEQLFVRDEEWGIDMLRMAGTWQNAVANGGGWCPHIHMPFGGNFISTAMADNGTAAELNAIVDRVIAVGGVAVLYSHLDGSTGAAAGWDVHFDYLAGKRNAGLVEVVTLDRLLELQGGGWHACRPRFGTI